LCATCGKLTYSVVRVNLACCRNCAISHLHLGQRSNNTYVNASGTNRSSHPNSSTPSLPLLPRVLGMTYRRARPLAQLRPATRPHNWEEEDSSSSMTHSSNSTEESEDHQGYYGKRDKREFY